MARAKLYQVISNRIRFTCSGCETKRSLPVPPNIRRRSVRCYKCGTLSQCNLNRRTYKRELQSGKVCLVLSDGKEVEIDLFDISLYGVGFDVPAGVVRKISINQEIQLRCSWNPRLFGQGRYRVKNIKGQRIGAINVSVQKFS